MIIILAFLIPAKISSEASCSLAISTLAISTLAISSLIIDSSSLGIGSSVVVASLRYLAVGIRIEWDYLGCIDVHTAFLDQELQDVDFSLFLRLSQDISLLEISAMIYKQGYHLCISIGGSAVDGWPIPTERLIRVQSVLEHKCNNLDVVTGNCPS